MQTVLFLKRIVHSNAFEECPSLREVFFSKNITRIEKEAFGENSSIRDIYFDGSQKEWEEVDKGDDAFWSNATIHYAE